MTTVRFYRDETKCSCCGRYIVNVIEIDEAAFGTTCGEIELKKIASENAPIKVVGKAATFDTAAYEMIEKARKARMEMLRKSLPNLGWHQFTPIDGLIESLFTRLGKGEQTAAWFAARLELKGVDVEAEVAAEFKRAMME